MKDEKMKGKGYCCVGHVHSGFGFGILLILIGVFWLLKDTVLKDLPFWPGVLILIGLYLIIRKGWGYYYCR